MLGYPKNLRVSDTIVYLPFELHSSRFREERMADLDGPIFDTAVAMPIGGGI